MATITPASGGTPVVAPAAATAPIPPASPVLGPSAPTIPSKMSVEALAMRQTWLEEQMQSKVVEYTDERPLHILIGTWNVNAKKPIEDLTPWLVDKTLPEPDIVAVGFQEIVDLNASNLLVDHTASKPWEATIERTLEQKYQLVASKHLVGLSLSVYAKRTIFGYVSDIQEDKVGVGIMGVGGNKGAVAIRFRVYDSTVCFVNAHLAAHQHNTAGRNSDYHNIISRVQFKRSPAPSVVAIAQANAAAASANATNIASGVPPSANPLTAATLAAAANAISNAQDSTPLTVFDHDFAFWLGDLNYRLTITDLDTVYDRIERKDYTYLLAHDQLVNEKAAGNAFKEWNEGTITFAPTYKYIPGTSQYDRRPDKKKRVPAWCDRIQWIGQGVEQLTYRRAELNISDHKPVSSLFSIKAREIQFDRLGRVYESLQRQLDSWENSFVPRLDVVPSVLDLGQICFDTVEKFKLRLSNTGQAMAQFEIKGSQPLIVPPPPCLLNRKNLADAPTATLPKPNPLANPLRSGSLGNSKAAISGRQTVAYPKPWMRITPARGLVAPKQTQEILVEVRVTKETAALLLTEVERISDVLIVHVENGSDHFVEVKGSYLKSCFGAPIMWLCQTPGPVRNVKPPSSQPASSVSALSTVTTTATATTSATTPASSSPSTSPAPTPTSASSPGNSTTGTTETSPLTVLAEVRLPPARRLPVPKEYWRIIDALHRHAGTPDLFAVDGTPRELVEIRECLDQGMEFSPTVTPHSFAEALIKMLESTPEPLFPAAIARMYNPHGTQSLSDFCRSVVPVIPPPHYQLFVYVLSLLRYLLTRSSENGLTADQLTLLFTNPLTHAEESYVPPPPAPAAGIPSNVLPSSPQTAALLHAGVMQRRSASGSGSMSNQTATDQGSSNSGSSEEEVPPQERDPCPYMVINHWLTSNEIAAPRR